MDLLTPINGVPGYFAVRTEGLLTLEFDLRSYNLERFYDTVLKATDSTRFPAPMVICLSSWTIRLKTSTGGNGSMIRIVLSCRNKTFKPIKNYITHSFS